MWTEDRVIKRKSVACGDMCNDGGSSAKVVATAMILASDEMVAEDVEFLPKLRGERKETRRGSEVLNP